VGGQTLLVAHEDCHLSNQEFRVPERGIYLFFFQEGERGKEKACPADYTKHNGHSPGARYLLISTAVRNCCMGSLFCQKVSRSSTNN
jgi:hypothetical protein